MKENSIEEDIKKCEEFINLSFLYGKLSFTKTQLYEYQKAMSNLLTRYKQLEEENKSKQKAYDDCYCEYKHYKQFDSIPKSKVKEFFSSRLEKYQEADDGKYEQDYLTRGELELVDRYKECKEIAKIILEEEINSEVPQNCIPTSLVKEKIEKLDNVDNAEALEDLMNRQNYTITELVQFVLREILKEKNSD